MTSIQGWENQPSIVELENLFTNQEAQAMQMEKASILANDEALFAGRRRYNNYKGWKTNNFHERENFKEKKFNGREQWKLKNKNGI